MSGGTVCLQSVSIDLPKKQLVTSEDLTRVI